MNERSLLHSLSISRTVGIQSFILLRLAVLFSPHHPLAATSCRDCSTRPRIDIGTECIGSKSCRKHLPSYSCCRSLHMLSLQHDSGNWSRPWDREALSDQDRYTVIGRQPSSHIRSGWYLYQAGSAGQLPSTMASTGGPVAHEEAGWCYSAENCEAWAWPSYLCTSPMSWVCLVSGLQCTEERQCNIRRSHCMASSSPRTWKSPGKYPASRTLRADTLPLLNEKDVVSQPVKACIPSNWRHLEPSLVHVWLMSSSAPSASGTCPQAGCSTSRTQVARTRRYRRKAHAPHSFPRRLPAPRSWWWWHPPPHVRTPLCPGCQWWQPRPCRRCWELDSIVPYCACSSELRLCLRTI